MSELTKAVNQVRQARWESWERMAAQLPDHHVLAVEMFRVDRNSTVAIFTLVKNGKVVQQVLRGDGRGLNVKPVVSREEHCVPIHLGRSLHLEAMLLRDALTGTDDGGPEAYAVAIGEPPPKQPPDPGIVAVGGTGLQNAFDTGEVVTSG
ncbi:MAG TPA: hypothetical protein VF469_09220 [Kofleriaceae bacterium]